MEDISLKYCRVAKLLTTVKKYYRLQEKCLFSSGILFILITSYLSLTILKKLNLYFCRGLLHQGQSSSDWKKTQHSGKMRAKPEFPKHIVGLFSVWDFFKHWRQNRSLAFRMFTEFPMDVKGALCFLTSWPGWLLFALWKYWWEKC